MCGRYYLSVKLEKVLKKYRIKNNNINFLPRPEIFPSEKAPVIITLKNKEIINIKWGFSSSFTNNVIINARSETIDKKSTFKKAFKKQRCIIPASGYFEWKNENKQKIKYNIKLADKPVFSFAGLYDIFSDNNGNSFMAFTIITTTANNKMSPIHNRMPVILDKKNENNWLNKDFNDLTILKKMLKPYKNKNLIVERNDQQLKFDF